MKARNLFSIIALMLFALSSCENSPVYNLEIYPRNVYIPKTGGEVDILVSANAPWSVYVAEDAKSWIEVDIEHSEVLEATLEISVISTNPSASELRKGVVRIQNGDNVQSINVSQGYAIVAKSKIIGKWEMTACEAEHMIGSEFTFNSGTTCVAKINIPGQTARDVDAVYTYEGNIIAITIPAKPGDDPKIITIAVKEIDAEENTIKAIAMGYDSTIEKIVE